MNLKLDSHVDPDGRVWLHLLNNEGKPAAMILCPLPLWSELKAAWGIVEARLIADGQLTPRDTELIKVPDEGASEWN
jgi:hypothetical protein